jgi:hypothetical protein
VSGLSGASLRVPTSWPAAPLVQEAALRGWRCVYLAGVNLEAGCDADAYVLLGRAVHHAAAAARAHDALPAGAWWPQSTWAHYQPFLKPLLDFKDPVETPVEF